MFLICFALTRFNWLPFKDYMNCMEEIVKDIARLEVDNKMMDPIILQSDLYIKSYFELAHEVYWVRYVFNRFKVISKRSPFEGGQ